MAVREALTPDDWIAFLNRALALDRAAIEALLRARIPCNAAMVQDPDIQVLQPTPTEPPTVGVLGLINGAHGAYGPERPELRGWGPIVAVQDEAGTLVRFARAREIRRT